MRHELDLPKFRELFPQFSGVSEARVQLMWDTAATIVSPWDSCLLHGDRLQTALTWLTAHLITLNGDGTGESGGSGGGVVTGSVIDKVQVQFAAPPTRNGWQFWLAQTPEGLTLWAMFRAWSAGGFYVGGRPERLAFRKVGGFF